MTPVVERLAELRKHLDHLRAIRHRVRSTEDLERDQTLHNEVLFSLLAVAPPEMVAKLARPPGFRKSSLPPGNSPEPSSSPWWRWSPA